MPAPLVAVAGASLVGGIAQAGAARSAANAQVAAAQEQAAVQREMYQQSREDLAPYRESGLPAVNALNYYLGLGPRPDLIGAGMGGGGGADGRSSSRGSFALQSRTPQGEGVARFLGGLFDLAGGDGGEPERTSQPQGNPNFVGFQETPGYQFARREGLNAVEASAAARGGLYSGAAMQALQQRGNDLANLEFNNYLNRLEGRASAGQNAAAQTVNVNQNTANALSTAYGNVGNAQAAGAIGVGNAFSGAINNGIGLWQYQNMLNRFPV